MPTLFEVTLVCDKCGKAVQTTATQSHWGEFLPDLPSMWMKHQSGPSIYCGNPCSAYGCRTGRREIPEKPSYDPRTLNAITDMLGDPSSNPNQLIAAIEAILIAWKKQHD